MIEIKVTGDTYHIRLALKRNGFRWNHIEGLWHRVENEESLDDAIEQIIPMPNRGITIRLRLQEVDKHGNPLSPVIRFCLKDVARPGVSVLEKFRKEIFGSCVSPIQSPVPTNPKKKEWKKLPPIDEGFF